MRNTTLRAVLDSISVEALRKIAVSIELWVLFVVVPRLTGSEQVQPLVSKNGRRYGRDSWTQKEALLRSTAAGGSSRTFLAGALGDLHIDNAINRAACNLLFDKLRHTFQGVRRLSVNFDPGTYAGHSYNAGLVWSADNKTGAPLPVKVRGKVQA